MKRILPFFAFLLLAAGVLAEDSRCYELRIYTAAEGKLEALNARFRDHTCALFENTGSPTSATGCLWMPRTIA